MSGGQSPAPSGGARPLRVRHAPRTYAHRHSMTEAGLVHFNPLYFGTSMLICTGERTGEPAHKARREERMPNLTLASASSTWGTTSSAHSPVQGCGLQEAAREWVGKGVGLFPEL